MLACILVVKDSLNFALPWSSVTLLLLFDWQLAGRVFKGQNVGHYHEFLQGKVLCSMLFFSTFPLLVT